MSELDFAGLPEVFACSLPDAAVRIAPAERGQRVRLFGENFLLLDRNRGFIRCRLPLAIQDARARFSYVCWLEVPPDALELNRSLWAEPTTRALLNFRGKLANRVPPFEEDAGRTARASMPDWREPMPVIGEIEPSALAEFIRPPGIELETHLAILGEVTRESFALLVAERLRGLWGRPCACEELGTKDWRAAPRKLVIAEFAPLIDGKWHYCTLGLSSRPMPGGDRTEFAWEMSRRITDGPVFQAMATIAAQPWRMKTAFFDGHVLPVPGGFPPGSDFRYALCYDASRAYPGLRGLTVSEQKVRILMPLPILEREKAAMRRNETDVLNLKDYLR